MIREGVLPGPIDVSLSPKRRRWSRATIEAYVAGRTTGWPRLVAVDSDPTPAHGTPRQAVAS